MRSFATLTVLAVVSPAAATITDVFSTTILSLEASVEVSGLSDVATPVFEPFVLDQLGTLPLTMRSVSAAIGDGSAGAELDASGAIDVRSNRIDLDYFGFAGASIAPTANDAFGFVKSRVGHVTRFTTDRPVELTLAGDASRSFSLFGSSEPLLPQTFVRVINEFDGKDIPLLLENPEGPFSETALLMPGSYQLQIAADATFQLFGFPEGDYVAESMLGLSASLVTIPSPASAPIVLALTLAGRRRTR